MPDTLIDALRATRPRYEQDVQWHRFLLDAYAGTGGFRGKVQQPPAVYWGSAAEVYANDALTITKAEERTDYETYLDRYPREDEDKFARRRQVAHYPNYIGPLSDMKLSFLLNKPWHVQASDGVERWRQDVDGQGKAFEAVRETVALRAATLGWTPVLHDAPPTPVDEGGQPIEMTRAQAADSGITLRMIPLFPANLVDWATDATGQLEWAKVRTDHLQKPSWNSEPMQVERYTIWTRTGFEVYEIRRDRDRREEARALTAGEHGHGRVPITIARHIPLPDERIGGIPMHGDVALENRRLFNLVSELDEHLRSVVFAFLQVPTQGSLEGEGGRITLGPGNALPVPTDSQQSYEYIAPPVTVSETYETRIENTIVEMYRMARAEFARMADIPESGVARRMRFATTNSAIGKFAKSLAEWEEDACKLTAEWLGEDPTKQTVTPPSDFNIEDLEGELAAATTALNLGLPARAEIEIKRRVVQRILPNLPKDLREEIEQQLDDELGRLEAMRAMDGELQGARTGTEDDTPPDDGGES